VTLPGTPCDLELVADLRFQTFAPRPPFIPRGPIHRPLGPTVKNVVIESSKPGASFPPLVVGVRLGFTTRVCSSGDAGTVVRLAITLDLTTRSINRVRFVSSSVTIASERTLNSHARHPTSPTPATRLRASDHSMFFRSLNENANTFLCRERPESLSRRVLGGGLAVEKNSCSSRVT